MWFSKMLDLTRLTRLQLRCLISFVLPFTMLLFSFVLLYLQRIFFADELAEKFAKSAMEILWAYFPTIGAYAWFHQSWPLEKKSKELTSRQVRFVLLQVPLLIGLWYFTLWNLGTRFFPQYFSPSWIPSICLEFEWISLQAFSIFAWIYDNWEKESAKSFNGERTKKQRQTIILFLLPLFLLISSCIAAHSFQKMGMTFEFSLAEALENTLFVYFPGVQIFVWISINWSKDPEKDQLPHLTEPVNESANSSCA